MHCSKSVPTVLQNRVLNYLGLSTKLPLQCFPRPWAHQGVAAPMATAARRGSLRPSLIMLVGVSGYIWCSPANMAESQLPKKLAI
eukprot:13672843-Heterocapsa_arctica.AAC.1